MWNNPKIYHKRFKIAILTILLCSTFGILGIIFQLEHISTIALGGIQAIALAFIAGDSYRDSYKDSNLNEENKYQEE